MPLNSGGSVGVQPKLLATSWLSGHDCGMVEESESSPKRTPQESVQAFLSHPIVAFVAALVLTTLSTSGVVNMTTSMVLLAGAWLLGIIGIHSAESRRGRLWITVAGGGGLAVALALLGWFELGQTTTHSSLNLKELAALVAGDLKGAVAVSPTAPSPAPSPVPEQSYRVVIRVPPAPLFHPPVAATPAPPTSSEDFSAILKRSAISAAKERDLERCIATELPVFSGLGALIVQAANFQNAWAYSRDDKKLAQEYDGWKDSVVAFLSSNKSAGLDSSIFDQAKEADTRPTLLFIHNTGIHAWNKFDVKRHALEQIRDGYDKSVCTTQSNAVQADNADLAARIGRAPSAADPTNFRDPNDRDADSSRAPVVSSLRNGTF